MGPWGGVDQIIVNDFKNHDLIATRQGVQLRLSNLPSSGELPYYSLPDEYHGNQLKSYGGYFRYEIEFSGRGSLNEAPDIILIVSHYSTRSLWIFFQMEVSNILQGNGYDLVYRRDLPISEGNRNSVAVPFSPGYWYNAESRLASREEIMMALSNVENILIKLQYIDQVQREIELLNIVMDSSSLSDQGTGSASFVEECRCPVGYSGLSCESCDFGYVRQQTGAWLGRCVRGEDPCRAGQYGDPERGIPCKVLAGNK